MKEPVRCMMPKEILRWYQHLPMKDQLEVSEAVQKQQMSKYQLNKGTKDGPAVHDNSNK